MKTRKVGYTVAAMLVCLLALLPSCGGGGSSNGARMRKIETDTIVHLSDRRDGPSCRVSMKYCYLEPLSDSDSISAEINRSIVRTAFGKKFSGLTPKEWVSKFVRGLVDDYLDEVEDLYKADIKSGMKPADAPSWYSYEFEFDTDMRKGREDVWNYVVSAYLYTGGAHANIIHTCINIDALTGKLLTKEDVFLMEYEREICKLIEEELIEQANETIDDASISSVADLQEYGILLDNDLYVPNNFILEEKSVTFVYNRYDIAPYSAGEFELTVPVTDLRDYMK